MYKVISRGLREYTGYKVTVNFKRVDKAIKEKNQLNKDFKDWEHTVEIYSNDKKEGQ